MSTKALVKPSDVRKRRAKLSLAVKGIPKRAGSSSKISKDKKVIRNGKLVSSVLDSDYLNGIISRLHQGLSTSFVRTTVMENNAADKGSR